MDAWKEQALKDAVHVDKRAELPPHTGPQMYFWDNGMTKVDGVKRQLLEQLLRKPLFASSRINLSAYIDKLRQDHRVPISTYFYTNPETGGRFGVYAIAKPIRKEA